MAASQATEIIQVRGEPAAVRTDWLCVGRSCWRGDAIAAKVVSRALESLGGLSSRVTVNRWVRYRIDLSRTPTPEPDVTLTQLSENLVASLRDHPDCAQEAFSSGLAFWDLGLRNGFVWYEAGQPMCFQWLLQSADVAALRARSPWANMYPPIAPGSGQVEKLWTFSTARQKGVATRFALALFAIARRRGLASLVTHIHESNDAARSWAQRTGWQPYGSIVRYVFDVPLLHGLNMSACEHRRAGEGSRAH